MSKYNQYTPDVKLPVNDPHEMDNLLKRERAALGGLMLRGSAEDWNDAGQCWANIDYALDNYALGLPRNEISLELAEHVAVNGLPRKPL